jgi:hypothetical protein
LFFPTEKGENSKASFTPTFSGVFPGTAIHRGASSLQRTKDQPPAYFQLVWPT